MSSQNEIINYLSTGLNNINSQLSTIANSIANTNSQLIDIANSSRSLSNDPWVKYGTIVSLLLGLIALYSANKDAINSWLFSLNIDVYDPFTRTQGALLISRLRIKNNRKYIVKNVTFWVVDLLRYQNNKWEKTPNFLEFPLRWTHTNDEYKDLSYKRPYTLDICEISCLENNGVLNPKEIHITSPIGIPHSLGLDDLLIGRNKIRITLYSESHPIQDYWLEITWDGTLKYPDITIIKINSH